MTDLNLPALREAVAKMTEGPWAVDARFGLDIVRADDVGQPHGGGATPELDARYCWVIAQVRADKPFDGCEAFTRRKFKGQQEPDADAAGIVALRNAFPAVMDELERLRAEPCGCACHSVGGHTDEPTMGMALMDMTKRALTAEAKLAALKGRTCETCRHQRYEAETNYESCDRLGIACASVGFTCGAWAGKEQG